LPQLAVGDSVITDLVKYGPAELESFWLIRRLIVKRIGQLQNEIKETESATYADQRTSSSRL